MGEILDWARRTIRRSARRPSACSDSSTTSCRRPTSNSKYKDRANWPSEMLAEMGNDEGRDSIERYRERWRH